MRKKYQPGAVSLFVVIFSALLITVVTVGFVSLMVRNQKQASDSDLSQSAYDSALAGVEDAKRAILRLENVCNGGSALAPECTLLKATLSGTCLSSVSNLSGVGDTTSVSEVKVKTNDNDETLNQAYTCVKISMNNPDYLGFLNKDSSNLIPLVGTDTFDRVKINWYLPSDLDSGVEADMPDPTAPDQDYTLKDIDDWKNTPSIMRAQLIRHEPTFKLINFDDAFANTSSRTLFLYPVKLTGIADKSFTNDSRDRKSTDAILHTASCNENFNNEGYACTATLLLPATVSAGDKGTYLNLAALYSKSNYKVALYNGPSVVSFDNVQPEIDSTGRANDVFRRVKSRVEKSSLDATSLAPFSAVDVEEDFCKAYEIFADKEPKNGCST